MLVSGHFSVPYTLKVCTINQPQPSFCATDLVVQYHKDLKTDTQVTEWA